MPSYFLDVALRYKATVVGTMMHEQSVASLFQERVPFEKKISSKFPLAEFGEKNRRGTRKGAEGKGEARERRRGKRAGCD